MRTAIQAKDNSAEAQNVIYYQFTQLMAQAKQAHEWGGIYWTKETELDYARKLTVLSDRMLVEKGIEFLQNNQGNFETVMFFHAATGQYRDQNNFMLRELRLDADSIPGNRPQQGEFRYLSGRIQPIDGRLPNSVEENAKVLAFLKERIPDVESRVPDQIRSRFGLAAVEKDSKESRADSKLGSKLTWGDTAGSRS